MNANQGGGYSGQFVGFGPGAGSAVNAQSQQPLSDMDNSLARLASARQELACNIKSLTEKLDKLTIKTEEKERDECVVNNHGRCDLTKHIHGETMEIEILSKRLFDLNNRLAL